MQSTILFFFFYLAYQICETDGDSGCYLISITVCSLSTPLLHLWPPLSQARRVDQAGSLPPSTTGCGLCSAWNLQDFVQGRVVLHRDGLGRRHGAFQVMDLHTHSNSLGLATTLRKRTILFPPLVPVLELLLPTSPMTWPILSQSGREEWRMSTWREKRRKRGRIEGLYNGKKQRLYGILA